MGLILYSVILSVSHKNNSFEHDQKNRYFQKENKLFM